MNNEFIVWDKEENKDLKINEFSISKDGKLILLENGKVVDVLNFGNRYTVHNYINKQDISNNKIYANYSIVEFCNTSVMQKPFSKNVKYFKGYFKYNNFRYDLINIYDGSVLDPRCNYGYKIIDTIQENKLGLIK